MVEIERGSEEDLKTAVGVLMVHNGLATVSRGAELSGLSHRDFMDVLTNYDVNTPFGPEDVKELIE